MDDPLRMYLVLQRGEVTELARAGELAGAAAVACVREPAFAEAVAAWGPRPGAGCPARVLAPSPEDFAAAARRDDLAACVADAGLTEVAPGTVTVLALA